jgi:FtsP/CotA-like multicopper oxidase with cupredoxin domain
MTMKHFMRPKAAVPVVLGTAALLALTAAPAAAAIQGIEGTLTGTTRSFVLTAKADYVTSADGASLLIWGLTDGTRAQYPAPTLIVNQGETIAITLNNELVATTSLIFPGHDVAGAGDCTDTSGLPAPGPGDASGRITCEAPAAGSATYTFPAENAGTYLYHSGTNAALQSEMGLFGAIIVRPYGFDELNPTAYGHPKTGYDREFLFILSEMDSRIHDAVEFGDSLAGTEYLGDYFSNYWFMNGRTAPDTLSEPNVPWLPTQPYNTLPRMTPGEQVLIRVVVAGRDAHPFHHHGNHALIVARDGRMLESAPGQGPDLGYQVFTIQAIPGETYDATFTWTGANMNWDIYGTPADGMPAHTCNGLATPSPGFDPVTHEYCPDHGKALPVHLPENLDLAFGGFWSGSPFMGAAGALPPGEGGLNPNSGYTFMWHSHTEKELTNNDIFPGGMLTMLIVEPPGTVIE